MSTGGHDFRFDFGDEQMINLADQVDYRFPHPIQRWVLPVLPMHQTLPDAGSAFLIAPGVAITAAHVVMDEAIRAGRVEETQFVAVFVTAEYPADDSDAVGGPLDVTHVVSSPNHDLAVITLRWPEINGGPMRFGAAPLTAELPKVGEVVLALGYTQIDVTAIGEDGMELTQVVTAAKGIIEEVLPSGRDALISNYPVAMGDFPTPGALSGGPVMNSSGRIFGAVSRSFAPFEEQSRWTSYASLLSPVFDLPFGAIVDGVEREYTIRELAHLGIVPNDGSF